MRIVVIIVLLGLIAGGAYVYQTTERGPYGQLAAEFEGVAALLEDVHSSSDAAAAAPQIDAADARIAATLRSIEALPASTPPLRSDEVERLKQAIARIAAASEKLSADEREPLNDAMFKISLKTQVWSLSQPGEKDRVEAFVAQARAWEKQASAEAAAKMEATEQRMREMRSRPRSTVPAEVFIQQEAVKLRERLSERHGPEQVIVIMMALNDPSEQQDTSMNRRISAALGNKSSAWRGRDLWRAFALAPVADIHAAAAKLDFLIIDRVDAETRTIHARTKADPASLP